MSKLTINATPITATKEFSTLHNRVSDLYNSLMEELTTHQQAELKELVYSLEQYERLFNNSVEFNGKVYSVKGGVVV